MADAEDSFDPKLIERESDEVDVCIVGGGKFFFFAPTPDYILQKKNLIPIHRTGGLVCSNQIKTVGE
jgi:hypothetical protein